MLNKVNVLVALKTNKEDVKIYKMDYYKEIDSSSYDFYENLNEVMTMAEEHLPDHVIIGVAPTVKPTKEDVFGNEIQVEHVKSVKDILE